MRPTKKTTIVTGKFDRRPVGLFLLLALIREQRALHDRLWRVDRRGPDLRAFAYRDVIRQPHPRSKASPTPTANPSSSPISPAKASC